MSLDVVLGAGGAFGWAWHLGVLDAVHERLGCELADAGAVIGTSAGAVIAMARLAGQDTAQTLDTVLQRPDSKIQSAMRDRRSQTAGWRRWLSPMAPSLLVRPGPFAGTTAWVGVLPSGIFTTATLRRFPAPTTWPHNLLVVGVSLATGRRVVWGPGHESAEPHDAMEASAAVPSLFEPKRIGGDAYVDGAVASPTSADLLADRGDSVVVVSSPMTRPGGKRVVRWWAKRRTAREVGRLRAGGRQVIVVEPSVAAVELATGYPRANPDAGPLLVAAAHRATCAALDHAGIT